MTSLETRRDRRRMAIGHMVMTVQREMQSGVTPAALEASKRAMLRLAAERALFTVEDFPRPEGDRVDCTYLVHQEPDGSCALYVNSSLPGEQSQPHDHGGTWAIIAAVDGPEDHRFYTYQDGQLVQTGDITLDTGRAVAMGPDGIHSIHGMTEPLMHLHLYGQCFENQGERRVFDPETGAVRRFVLEDIGFLEDRRDA